MNSPNSVEFICVGIGDNHYQIAGKIWSGIKGPVSYAWLNNPVVRKLSWFNSWAKHVFFSLNVNSGTSVGTRIKIAFHPIHLRIFQLHK